MVNSLTLKLRECILMADIIDLTDVKEFRIRGLERLLEEGMKHPDENVLALWTELVKESLRKYPGPPTPTQSQISIEFPECVSQKEIERIVVPIKEFIASYKNDVQEIMQNMLTDIALLQKEVAEKRCSETR